MHVATRAPRGHLIVAVVASLWSLAGVAAFLAQETMSATTLATLPADQRALWASQPAWNVAAYAVATLGQLAGAVGLLLRRRWAVPAFAIAIAGILVQYSYPFLIARALSVTDPAKSAFPLLILAIAVGLFVYARWAARKGLLK